MSKPFHVGQQVRLLSPTYTIPQGRIGTIVQIYLLFQGLYEVQFDGNTRTRLIYGIHLETARLDTNN